MGMDRVRFECRLSTGRGFIHFWVDELCHLQNMMDIVCSGVQARDSIKLTICDTTKAAAKVTAYAPTVHGFRHVVDNLVNSMEAIENRQYLPNEGRDVVVEVKFACHEANLEDARTFAANSIEEALGRTDEEVGNRPGAWFDKFSLNGEVVGDFWFE